jgi:hypothetical protein
MQPWYCRAWVARAAIAGGLLCLAGALAYGADADEFAELVRQAAVEQGVSPTPAVQPMQRAEIIWRAVPTVQAFIVPRPKGFDIERDTIVLVTDPLLPMQALCVARHEVGHIRLGHVHGARTAGEARKHHDELYRWLWMRYGQRGQGCPPPAGD